MKTISMTNFPQTELNRLSAKPKFQHLISKIQLVVLHCDFKITRVVIEYQHLLYEGDSSCSPTDQFQFSTGFSIALSRALAKIPNQNLNSKKPRQFQLRNKIIVEEADESPITGKACYDTQGYSNTYKIKTTIPKPPSGWGVGDIRVFNRRKNQFPAGGVHGSEYDIIREIKKIWAESLLQNPDAGRSFHFKKGNTNEFR